MNNECISALKQLLAAIDEPGKRNEALLEAMRRARSLIIEHDGRKKAS